MVAGRFESLMQNSMHQHNQIMPLRRGLRFGASLFLLFLLALKAPAFAQGTADGAFYANSSPVIGAIYESAFGKDNVEIFSPRGVQIGLVGKIGRPTGLAFDKLGNLFVVSDDSTAGYSIKKVLTDGTISTFTTAALSGPHGAAFDAAGNLYVANNNNNTIAKFTPDGVATVFADRAQGLVNPLGLAFDAAGNLYVTNNRGGPNQSGRVIRLNSAGQATAIIADGLATPYGVALDAAGNIYVSINGANMILQYAPDGTPIGTFCTAGLASPYGMTFDSAGTLYVCNNNTNTIEKYAPDGTDLGVFAATRGGPHFLAIYYP